MGGTWRGVVRVSAPVVTADGADSGDLPSGTSIKEAGVGICDQPGHGWAVVLRRRPARIVEGQQAGPRESMPLIPVIGCGPADAFVNVPVFPAELRDAVRPDVGDALPGRPV